MALDSTPLQLDNLPVILAGPVLRRLTRTEVSVWVACTLGDQITFTVRHRIPGGASSTVDVTPTKVGLQLFMTVLTAPAPDGQFGVGEIYEYELDAPWTAARPIDWTPFLIDENSVTRPTFLGPPDNVDDLVILHASCRKPHGGGHDGLALAELAISSRFEQNPGPQPQLMLLSGDQIYVDEVGHPLAVRINRLAEDLIGIDETDVFGPVPRIGDRKPATNGFGFTTGAGSNHLWSYGEFMAMYLLAWSNVLWPDQLEPFPDNPIIEALEVAESAEKPGWDRDLGNLGRFRDALPRVVRLLANVPSLMIFDDHEVTDDWNLDFSWISNVYANTGGRRVITNGLLAYSLCQHWGNSPDRFDTPGSPEAVLLTAVSDAVAASTSPALAAAALLGMPPLTFSEPPPPVALRDSSSASAIRYDTTLEPEDGWPARIVLLDERTAREFTRTDNQSARISRAALAQQLPLPDSPAPVTIVVAAAPIFGSDIVEDVIQPTADLLPGGGEFADFESWSAVRANHQDLLERLSRHHPVVVLSGDVHYGFTARMTRTENGTITRVAQLTGSAAKNTEIKNAAISMFSELILRLGLERVRAVAGYSELELVEQEKLHVPPPAGNALAWDDAVDVLLGRVAREATSVPTAMPAPVAAAYGLPTPDWEYVVEPVDDPETDYAAPTVDSPWDGWDPDKSLTMSDALQQADLHRIGRMFIGLPQFSLITFSASGGSLSIRHQVSAPVGDDDSAVPGVDHAVITDVQLA